MTITFKSISMDIFLDFQKSLINDYLEFSPVFDQAPRKAWESKYDPKYIKGTGARRADQVVPDVSSLPTKRWVAQRIPEGSVSERRQWAQDRDAWLVDQKLKYQTCLVLVDGEPTWVHLFKKVKDAMMFKLAWG